MRRASVACALVGSVVIALTSCSSPPSGEVSQTGSEALRGLDAEEGAFLTLINQYRQSQGIAPLTATPLLNQISYDHSLDMAVHNYFDHNDLQGNSPFQRMAAAGYNGGFEGENIAAGGADAQSTFTLWKNSPGHNANMLGTHYTAIGIGRAYSASSTYGWYWTTDFGDVVDGSVSWDGGTPSADAGAVDAGASDSGSVDSAPPPPATFSLVSLGSGKCLAPSGGVTTPGTSVVLWTCGASGAQSFALRDTGGGSSALVETSSGNCLDVTHSGRRNGTNIQLWTCNGTGAQSFQLGTAANGAVTLVNPASGKCVDVAGNRTADGTKVELWTCTGGSNQEIRLTPN